MESFKNIKDIAKFNLIYSVQASSVDQLRKKQQKNPLKKINVIRRIFWQHGLLAIMYLGIFGVPTFFMNLSQQPALYTRMLGMFVVLTILQLFLTMFNVFYESKDIQSYRSLPVTEIEVILGKGITVVISVLYFVLPIFSYCISIQFHFNHPWWWAIIVGIIMFVLLITVITLVSFLLVNIITRTAIFKKYKRIVSGIITTGLTFAIIIMIFLINPNSSFDTIGTNSENAIIFPLWLFFGIAKEPLSASTLIHLLIWIILLIGLILLVRNKVIPTFYEDALEKNTLNKRIHRTNKKSRAISQKTLKQQLWNYHIGLISDANLLVQIVIFPPLLIFIMCTPTLFNNKELLQNLEFTIEHLPFIIVVGSLYALMSAGTLSTIIISLDRENFIFFKSLPFDLKEYLWYKFWFSFWIQAIVPLIVMSGICIYINLPIYLWIALVITWLLCSFILSEWSFMRDYRLLELNWQNVTQLLNRGMNQGLKILLLFVEILIGIFLIIGILLIIYKLPQWGIHLLSSVLWMIIFTAVYAYHSHFKRFMDKF